MTIFILIIDMPSALKHYFYNYPLCLCVKQNDIEENPDAISKQI